jgi:cytochrome c biogenesis protein
VSRSPSDATAADRAADSAAERAAEPLRPSDHADAQADIVQPALGVVGWLRWGWRQLT